MKSVRYGNNVSLAVTVPLVRIVQKPSLRVITQERVHGLSVPIIKYRHQLRVYIPFGGDDGILKNLLDAF